MSSSRSTSPRRSWWGDRGVKVKVLTAVGAAAVVAAGVGVMGLSALSASADTTHTLYASNLAGVSAVGDMNVVIGAVRKSSRDALITPDRAEAQQILDSLPQHAGDYHAAADAYAASFPTPEKQAMVDRPPRRSTSTSRWRRPNWARWRSPRTTPAGTPPTSRTSRRWRRRPSS